MCSPGSVRALRALPVRYTFRSSNPIIQPFFKGLSCPRVFQRPSSSASGPVQYSSNEIADLDDLLSDSLRRRARSIPFGPYVGYENALSGMNSSPSAPADWWEETYNKSLGSVRRGFRGQLATKMLVGINRRSLKARWSSQTYRDVRRRLITRYILHHLHFGAIAVFLHVLLLSILCDATKEPTESSQ